MKVKKRDGKIEDWDSSKIISAIHKALKNTGEKISDWETIIQKVEKECQKVCVDGIVTVPNIHRIVEMVLMTTRMKKTAREYIEYRTKRDFERLRVSKIMRDIEGLNNETDEDILNQNANKASRQLATHRDFLAGIVSKEVALEFMPDDVRQAHTSKIYAHDQDYAITAGLHNCGVYDYASMLKHGFRLGNADIEPPKSIGTACTVLSQIASTISSSSYGGQSMHRYTEMLRPYAIKSLKKQLRQSRLDFENIISKIPVDFSENRDVWKKLKKECQKAAWRRFEKEVHDAQQTFIYQINTICGTNGQSAFCTISIYPSTDKMCRFIARKYLECHMEGIGAEHRTPVFPKVVYFVKKGLNLDKTDPNYDELCLAMECSTKRMYPDYIMVDSNTKMTGFSDGVTPMGCRSFVPVYIENGVEKYTGRYNLGVVSVNVPYAAAEAGGDKKKFFEILDSYCELAYRYHMIRINRFKKTKARQNPILWMTGALANLKPFETVEKTMYDGNATASLGYVGVYEAQEICGDTSKDFAMEIVKFLKGKCDEWKEKTRIAFSLYGTPKLLGL